MSNFDSHSIAHIRKDDAGTSVCHEPLSSTDPSNIGHLERVSAKTAHFAKEMMSETSGLVEFSQEMGRLIGGWHDLGKYSTEFQRYLRNAASRGDGHSEEIRGKVDHATAGAQYAVENIPGLGVLMAFAIAGHHTGLMDWSSSHSVAALKARLKKTVPDWQTYAPQERLSEHLPKSKLPRDGFACAFLVRMLFSCLTDADFLSTEAFMNPAKSTHRMVESPKMVQLAEHLQKYLERFSSPNTPVQRRRQEIVRDCLHATTQRPGFFSLTVPTGGGKTLSSLAFALNHAAQHNLRRVICAIPFTSIIEQNAQAYREVFEALGEDVVLEHHASLDPEEPRVMASRLAAENWDAPLIVTTNVQLFETLFANRPGRCRKLHNIARSVIVLDEVQTLPVSLLKPSLAALQTLVVYHGCTVLLSTATQPALLKREAFDIGLTGVREIVSNPQELYTTLKRVAVRDAGQLSLEEVVTRLAQEEQSLVIVNTRRHAWELYQRLQERMKGEGCFHLSALMCPQHRSGVLETIKQRLNHKKSCRVVATQLVEAGVDLDFPVVYRSQAGLDAIAQAAGRCNREGKQPSLGKVWVFTPEEASFTPKGELKQAAGHAREIMRSVEHKDHFLSLKAMEHYFRLHYWQKGGKEGLGWDQKGVMACFNMGRTIKEPFLFQFRTAAEKFQWIEDSQQPVIVPWDQKAERVIQQLRAVFNPEPAFLSWASRSLQRYVVTIPERHRKTLWVEVLHDRFCILLDPKRQYAQKTGLILSLDNYCDPESLVCG